MTETIRKTRKPSVFSLDTIKGFLSAGKPVYQKIVERLANGEEIPEPEIRDALDVSGRSTEALRVDAERLRARLRALDDLAKAAAMAAEVEAAQKDWLAKRRRIDEVKQEAKDAIAKAEQDNKDAMNRHSELTGRMSRLRENANKVLSATMPSSAREELERAEQELSRLRTQQGNIQRRIQDEKHTSEMKANSVETSFPGEGKAIRNKSSDRVAKMEAELKPILAKVKELETAIPKLRAKLHDPLNMVWPD